MILSFIIYIAQDPRLKSIFNFPLCYDTVLYSLRSSIDPHHSFIHSSDTSLSLSTTALAVALLGRALGAGAGLDALAVLEVGLVALEAGLAGAYLVSLHNRIVTVALSTFLPLALDESGLGSASAFDGTIRAYFDIVVIGTLGGSSLLLGRSLCFRELTLRFWRVPLALLSLGGQLGSFT